ncbi:MAG: hypothetical protein ACRD0P_22360 [Stackebrandtia sp.]
MAEHAPDGLLWLSREIIKVVPSAEMSGIVGDPSHTYGYHRCRNVLPASDYSVKLAADRAGDGDAAAALDIKYNAAWMKTITSRLLKSAKDKNDPRLNCIREFYGTLDGRRVTGWDCYYGEPATSDDSHLWHVHLSVLRKYTNNKTELSKVLDVITGKDNDDMELSDKVKVPGWLQENFDDLGANISVQTALASGYGHARSTKEYVLKLAKESRLRDEAVLNAIKGLDTAAVIAAIEKRAAEDAKRDAALAALVEGYSDGSLQASEVADKVVSLIAGKLSGAGGA